MTDDLKTLLIELFKDSVSSSKGIDAVVFRAKNHEKLNDIDQLESCGYIERRDEKYYLRLPSLIEIEEDVYEAKSLLILCEQLFQLLKNHYIEKPKQNVFLNDISHSTDLPLVDVNKAFSYMIQSGIFGGYTTNFYAKEDSWVQPSEQILRHKCFKDTIQKIPDRLSLYADGHTWVDDVYGGSIGGFNAIGVGGEKFINEQRIEHLRELEFEDFDLLRLIRILEEINTTKFWGHNTYLF